jgi:hypothetical protein
VRRFSQSIRSRVYPVSVDSDAAAHTKCIDVTLPRGVIRTGNNVVNAACVIRALAGYQGTRSIDNASATLAISAHSYAVSNISSSDFTEHERAGSPWLHDPQQFTGACERLPHTIWSLLDRVFPEYFTQVRAAISPSDRSACSVVGRVIAVS